MRILACILMIGFASLAMAQDLDPTEQFDETKIAKRLEKAKKSEAWPAVLEELSNFRAIGIEPDPSWRFYEGKALLAVGRSADAEFVLRDAMERNPTPGQLTEIRRMLAAIQAARGAHLDLAMPVGKKYVSLQTTDGEIILELDADRAPLTVANFLEYVKTGFYAGTIFHRVIPDFVIQGGGYLPDYSEKETRGPIPNESSNRLPNRRGSIAMARLPEPDTADSQFYINLKDNRKLNYRESAPGYTVFGWVIDGFDVVKAIANIPRGPAGPFEQDVPFRPVILESAKIIEKPVELLKQIQQQQEQQEAAEAQAEFEAEFEAEN